MKTCKPFIQALAAMFLVGLALGLGEKIDPKFIEALRKASRREKYA